MPQIPPSIERLLLQATHEAQVLAALTPVDAQDERARLTRAVRTRRTAQPRWSYNPRPCDDLRRALSAAERELSRMAAAEAEAAVDHLVLARVRELSIEAALCAAAGTSEVATLSRERFPAPENAVRREAAELCARWLEETEAPDEAARIRSDSDDPRSLLSRMRAAVGHFRLPFSVVTRDALASLAATGENVILVATGRLLREEDAVRTVLHEIEGHALPRARAARTPLVLFRAGTARGVDHQEGRALLLEERAGLLRAGRRRQLAARHRAVEAMLDGATFDDAARMLVDAHGLDAADAVLVAERAFRGHDGTGPGLGRERVYLESLVLVRRHLAQRPEDEDVLACGQVAVEACEPLGPHVRPG